jgi:hypothetical protein
MERHAVLHRLRELVLKRRAQQAPRMLAFLPDRRASTSALSWRAGDMKGKRKTGTFNVAIWQRVLGEPLPDFSFIALAIEEDHGVHVFEDSDEGLLGRKDLQHMLHIKFCLQRARLCSRHLTCTSETAPPKHWVYLWFPFISVGGPAR